MIEEAVEDPVFHCGERLVRLEVRILRDDRRHRVRSADRLLRVFPDDPERLRMADHVVLAQFKRIAARTLHDVDFVDGHPEIDVFFQNGDDEVDIAFKVVERTTVGESAPVPEPGRIAAVGDRDKRMDARLLQTAEKIHIVIDRLLTEFSLLRLNPRPRNREPVGLMTEGFQQFDILPVEPVAVARLSGVVGKPFRVHRLIAPVDRVNVIPFDLMGCGRAAPDEVFRECDGGVVVQIEH